MAFGLVAQQFVRLGILSTSDHASVVSINLFVALLCGCIVIGHLLEESRWINESITALVIVSSPFFLPGLPVGKARIFLLLWARRKWVDSVVLVLLLIQGVCTGVVILLTTKGKSSHIFVFSEDLFFIYLLPPIIFNAG
ncbi:hypothetical protein BHE74_00028052 [Ensete ventricosum]|uniref:Uncharacterized protein n=1 Tax=Ensete ventricosum TaxID=4639 RepID=A0A444GCU6_ENSVE|nr:hypothetical protein GW17_00002605 [Ensete ventricosum]RWW64690.1 hypothetical protein BHE74_00028052 [Ensete ventricosum]RZR72930.1 hypothetical protein BHM03_00018656 [Ensete ventricosum]